jgi:Reverse transcriptase (RNA-dependent DNA polymerase)/RNase H-like domain found in reverse transcriptase
MKKDHYPLPLITDLLDAPRKARIYTKIDLRHAFHIFRVAEGDEWKTAFRTQYGSFEWQVMLFGLTNGPAVFQCFMNDVFGDMLDVCVIVYLNGILIYSNDPAKHREHICEVLRRLRKHGLFSKANKGEWHRDSVEFLGYMLSADGFTMSVDKIQTIQDCPEPRKVKDIQSFLGFANFYRRFIYNYSDITVPLTQLTRKGTPGVFTKECRESFNFLKKAFTSAPILLHWVPDKPMVMETDTSDYALGTIMSLFNDEGVLHPVAFHSRTFTSAKLNYDVHDKYWQSSKLFSIGGII